MTGRGHSERSSVRAVGPIPALWATAHGTRRFPRLVPCAGRVLIESPPEPVRRWERPRFASWNISTAHPRRFQIRRHPSGGVSHGRPFRLQGSDLAPHGRVARTLTCRNIRFRCSCVRLLVRPPRPPRAAALFSAGPRPPPRRRLDWPRPSTAPLAIPPACVRFRPSGRRRPSHRKHRPPARHKS